MTQEAIELRTTGDTYPGVSVIQGTNKALQTIATDFAGSADPAGLPGCGPFCTWADTGNMLFKRRNAANSAWVTLGPLFRSRQSSLLRVVTMAASGAWTPGSGCESAEVEIWGGGGGGSSAGGVSTFVSSPGISLSAGGGHGMTTSSPPDAVSSGGDINIRPVQGNFFSGDSAGGTLISGRDAPRGGGGGGGAGLGLHGGIPGGGAATSFSGQATRYGPGSGGYVYKFIEKVNANAVIVIGGGGGGSTLGGAGLCIIKEYGSL